MKFLFLILRRILAVAVVLVLVGCSALQMTYNNADLLARYKASDYVNLSASQVEQFRLRFALLHQWHRNSELPEYVPLLQAASNKIGRGINAEDVSWAIVSLRARYRLVAARAAEEAAPILAGLDPAQLADLEKSFAESNRKFQKDNLDGDAQKLRRKHAGKIEDYFKDWTGSLNDQQLARIGDFVDQYIGVLSLRVEDRKRWQREALVLLRNERDPTRLASRLAAMFSRPEEGRTPQYQSAMNSYEATVSDLVVDIDRMLTPEQRARAVRRMQRYAEDLAALAGRKVAPGSS